MLVSHLPLSWAYFFAFFLGASLTSFARLAVFRLPHQLGWRAEADPNLTIFSPPSQCDGCGVSIRLAYLIPILGWFIARGRCPVCGLRVSWHHPLLETIGGIGSALAFFYWGFNAMGFATMLLWLVSLFLAEIDWKEHWLPAVVTLPLFWCGLLLSPFTADITLRVWGAFAGFILMWASMLIAGRWRGVNALAGGDITLAAAAGAWLGLGRMPLFLGLSAVIFILYAFPARLKGQSWVAMGPALVASLLLSLFAKSWG